MPKNRKLTYSDQQSQAAHEQRVKKLQPLRKDSPSESPAATPKKSAKKKKTGTEL